MTTGQTKLLFCWDDVDSLSDMRRLSLVYKSQRPPGRWLEWRFRLTAVDRFTGASCRAKLKRRMSGIRSMRVLGFCSSATA